MAADGWAERAHRLDLEPIAHVYTVDGAAVRSATQILDDAALTVDYSEIPPHQLRKARNRGIHVDACCDLLDEGDDVLDWSSVHPDAVGYVNAWRRFRADHDYRPHASQIPLYHPEQDYAGTLQSVLCVR